MTNDQPAAGISHPDWFEEALSFHERGEFAEAGRRYQAILEQDAGHLDALVHLGLVQMQQGRLGEAERLFRQAVEHHPDSAAAETALANALLAQTRLHEAVAAYERAIAIDPGHAEAHYGLASALRSLKHHADAIPRFERAIAIDPDYAEAHYGLATTLQSLNRQAEAIPSFEQALSVDPDYAEARYGLGIALQALDRDEEALRCYRSAVASAPRFADAHNNLGVALQSMGKIEDARHSFEQAIALTPGRPTFYYNLFTGQRTKPGDPNLEALLSLANAAPSMPAEEQVSLHFALGKALADLGECQRSFGHFLQGNALKRRELLYDEAAERRLFADLRSVFGAGLMAAVARRGDPSSLPVFIVGMPRSGSTLVEQILASHPEVFAAGERLDLRDALNSFGDARGARLPFPERFAVATGEDFRWLAADYLDRLKAVAARVPGQWQRITDKNLANFRLVGLIHLILPNARIIHTVRDPIDTCLSCFSTLFSADVPFSYDLGELGRFYGAYSGLMEHWRSVLPPGVLLDVQYEQLVADFEFWARRIVAHCGLAWDPACLAFDKAPRAVKTASAAQVRQPLYKSSVGRWRPAPEQLKPLLEGLARDATNTRQSPEKPSQGLCP